MSTPDEYPPITHEVSATDLRRQRIGLFLFAVVLLAMLCFFLVWLNGEEEIPVDAELQAQMEFMEDFLSALQNVGFMTYTQQHELTRAQFNAAWSGYLDNISAESPDFARQARKLWAEQIDIWGNPLRVDKGTDIDGPTSLIISLEPDRGRPQFRPTAIFYVTSWDESESTDEE